jgi:uncharacterized iron-regulated membrane protein
VHRLILILHLSLAVTAGLFMVVLGLSGSIMAFEPELDRLLHPHLSYVKPKGNVLSLGEIGNAVTRQFQGEPVVAYLPSESPDLSSEVILPRGIVCVNQYTGQVLGLRTRGQTFFGLARELHVRLASGNVGRNIMRWSGVAMFVSLASGVYLWWPSKQVRIRGNWRSAGFWFGLHSAVGIFSLIPFLVLAVTGTVIGFEDQAATLIGTLMGSTQVGGGRNVPRQPATPGAAMITPDQAVAIALAQMPGMIPYRVQMPAYGGAYRVSLDYTPDRVAGDRNMIAVDPYVGTVIFSSRSNDLSPAERILATNEAIHTGQALGMPTKLLVCLASLIVPVQVISGLLLWLRRRRPHSAGD